MTKNISDLLDAAARQTVPVVRAVRDDQFDDPTPCADYSVRDLLNHLFHVVVSFQELAARRDADFSSTPDRLGASGDWRDRFAAETDDLTAAWAAPGADEGTAGQMNLPARTVGGLALTDLTIHGWDLARATRQAYTADPAAVAEVSELVERMGPTAREAKQFGEPVPVPHDASPVDRLLAATGRDPRWTPGT
jgi:uncharacterized protein (TIGR03086 family)